MFLLSRFTILPVVAVIPCGNVIHLLCTIKTEHFSSPPLATPDSVPGNAQLFTMYLHIVIHFDNTTSRNPFNFFTNGMFSHELDCKGKWKVQRMDMESQNKNPIEVLIGFSVSHNTKQLKTGDLG